MKRPALTAAGPNLPLTASFSSLCFFQGREIHSPPPAGSRSRPVRRRLEDRRLQSNRRSHETPAAQLVLPQTAVRAEQPAVRQNRLLSPPITEQPTGSQQPALHQSRPPTLALSPAGADRLDALVCERRYGSVSRWTMFEGKKEKIKCVTVRVFMFCVDGSRI